MTRLPASLALSFALVVGGSALAQSTPQRSLAERLSSFRDGWSFDDQAEASDAESYRVAQRNTASTSNRQTAPAEQRTAFPRVNPSELMPRNWFGNQAEAAPSARQRPATTGPAVSRRLTPPQPVAAPAKPKPTSTQGATGSARARLLRDMQRPADEATALSAAKPSPRLAQARAGSILSPNAPQTTPSRRAIAAQNARLARSIAAEVAGSIGSANEANEPQPLVAANPADDETRYGNSDERFTIEGSTPTEAKTAEKSSPLVAEVAADPITPIGIEAIEPAPAVDAMAETDSGRIVVATKPQETRTLPLFIGSRYNEHEDASTVETSKPAAKAFASASPIATVVKAVAGGKSAPEAVEDDLLFTQQMPVLVSKVLGPKTITVGHEATYRVLLANRGDVGADQVVTRITVPEGAEVMSTKAATGIVDRSESMSGSGTLVWRTEHLAANGIAKLDLRLIARTGNPIELGVAHSHQPIDGRTLVQVQEPKLQIDLVGPEEVLYGKPQTFRLTLSNPGTGVAKNVRLHLTPPGGDADRSTSHDFGDIAAGDESTVEIELTAREAGQLAINAAADANGDVSASTVKEVFCRRPKLVVDWRGPTDRYAGAPAVYYFRVRNPGTAVAPDVVLSVDLPEGFEVLASDDTPETKNNRIAFRAGSLRPGDDTFFELRGILRQGGANEIKLRAAGSDETRSASVVATTEVIALADLKLDVLDPKGPVATGQEIAYEIRVTNRGSNDAHDVRVIGLFSEGIEPHHVDGGTSETLDGRVAFDMVDRIAAGEERVFTIHARAYEEGTHLFRAEVLCRDLEIKLAAEETTRFFKDEAIDIAGDGYPSDNSNSFYPR